MIEHESSMVIARPANEVFAFVTDLPKAPSWIEGCVEIRQVSEGPKTAGTRLHYKYNQSGRSGEMDGVILGCEVSSKWEMKFADSMFDVEVGFRFAPESEGTRVIHRIAITPKSFMAKMMTPMIQAGNRKQVESNLTRLKQCIG